MASLRRALPSLARCERPRNAFSRFWRDQPGRLAQGPEEKCVCRPLGRFGGGGHVSTLPDSCSSVGRSVPPARLMAKLEDVNSRPLSSEPGLPRSEQPLDARIIDDRIEKSRARKIAKLILAGSATTTQTAQLVSPTDARGKHTVAAGFSSSGVQRDRSAAHGRSRPKFISR